jgi:glyoxylase-like metal-dependent hydrolase (beta-lactamase superfamily II)
MSSIYSRIVVRTAAALLLACAAAAHAAAPLLKGQTPGWYRMLLGQFEITAISDGTVDLPVDQLLTNTTPAQVQAALAKEYGKLPVETSINAYLVNTGDKLVLIDTGAAQLFGPTLGRLLENLKASGYRPEQVDEIYITHMHPDHIGGLLDGNQPAFPNAIVRADQREAAFWLSSAKADSSPDRIKPYFKGAMAALEPYVKAGKFVPFDGPSQLVPGVRAVATYGHTAGHSVYVIESMGEKMVVLGDLMHVGAVQFPDPKVTILFDEDSKAAMPQRLRAFDDAARGGYFLAVAHVSFPGIGKLRRDGKGYRWIPVNYTAGRR